MGGAKRDYYKILGVGPIATLDEVRKAYRSASKKYHPDLNPDLKLFSEEKMRDLVEAYEVLSDSEKRKEYDRQPHLQLRRSRRTSSGPAKGSLKASFKKEDSLLERMFSPFLKKNKGESKPQFSPKDADLRFTLGLSMSENESFYDRAIEEFQRALLYDSGLTEARWNLGILCYRKGLFEEAVVNFQKVLAVNKEDAHAKKLVEMLRDELA